METLNSHNTTKLKVRLPDIRKKLKTVTRHAKLVTHTIAAQRALNRTLECTDTLQRALRSHDAGGVPINWIKQVLPTICFAATHIPNSLHYNRRLVEELTTALAHAEGSSRRLLKTLLESVNRASEQHRTLFRLLLEVKDRYLAGLADQID